MMMVIVIIQHKVFVIYSHKNNYFSRKYTNTFNHHMLVVDGVEDDRVCVVAIGNVTRKDRLRYGRKKG